MKQKQYQRPTMKVFEVKQTGMLMMSNGFGASRTNYTRGRSDGGSLEEDEIWQ